MSGRLLPVGTLRAARHPKGELPSALSCPETAPFLLAGAHAAATRAGRAAPSCQPQGKVSALLLFPALVA